MLGRINKEGFDKIRNYFPSFHESVKKSVLSYTNPWKDCLRKFLKHTPYFADLNDYKLTSVIYKCRMMQFDKDDTLFKAGDVVEGIYIVLKGYVILEFELKNFGTLPLKVLPAGSVLNFDRVSK